MGNGGMRFFRMADRPRVSHARREIRWGAALLSLVGVSFGSGGVASRPEVSSRVQFNRDIRQILAENCFTCHGQDRGKRMANLRLDVREEAIARGAFVPGRPEQSKLVARVFAANEGRRMPPAFSHKRLTAVQKEVLRR